MTKISGLADALLLLWVQKKEEIGHFTVTTFTRMQEVLEQNTEERSDLSLLSIEKEDPSVSLFSEQWDKRSYCLYLEQMSSRVTDVLMEQLVTFHKEVEVLIELISILHGSTTIEPSIKWETQKKILHSSSQEFKAYRTQCYGFIYRYLRELYMYQSQQCVFLQEGDTLYNMIYEEFLNLLQPVENYILYIDKSSQG